MAIQNLNSVKTLVVLDGNMVGLVPPGYKGVMGIVVEMALRNIKTTTSFWTAIMEFRVEANNIVEIGGTILFLKYGPSLDVRLDIMASLGYRYATIQVYKCHLEHASILERGSSGGSAPQTIGTTTNFYFGRDPGSNWIEISQRAQLTGYLN